MTAQPLMAPAAGGRTDWRALWLRLGGEPALFSLKCLLAAVLAYYVALQIGLTRPFWAVTTSYIVAQPLAGAVLSKAVFRIIGTVLGATAAVVLVPGFVNEPMTLGMALGLWLGFCLYLSLLDRTPRAYVFLLAGYTASIIGFPSVAAPGDIFNIAIIRVQEITIGILAGSFIHGTVLPRSVADLLLKRIDTMLADAERWSADSLTGEGGEALARDRRRLALDVNELHQLSIHLPFDTGRLRPRVRTVRALQDQLSFILPLASGIEDRLIELRRSRRALTREVTALIEDVRLWLLRGECNRPEADRLIARAAALEPEIAVPLSWQGALRLNITGRLAELIGAHRDARALREQVRSPTVRAVSTNVAALLANTRWRALHRDRGVALRAAFGSFATVVLGCAFWIYTGWPDGAGAVLIAGVCCALFGSVDEPAPVVMKFFWGSLLGVLLAAFYAYGLFPQIASFPLLMLVLAPAFLVMGMFLAAPRPNFLAFGALLGLINSVGLSDRYAPGFAAFVNGSLAQLMGTFFAAVTTRLFQTVGTERSVERLIRAGWHDLAKRANRPGAADAMGWTSRMLDRIGLLAPRMAARKQDPGKPLLDVLIDLRIGLIVGELRNLRLRVGAEDAAIITPVLAAVAALYRARRFDALCPPGDGLLRCIDRAMRRLAAMPSVEDRRMAVLSLTSLRRNLYPAAPAFEGKET